MKIDKLYLRNFRGISDAEIEFNGKSTVIYGINGMGKTTILDACNIIFSKILHEVTDDIQIEVYMIKEKDVKLGESLAKIEIHILDDDKTFVYWRKRKGEKNIHKEEQLRNIAAHLRKQNIDQYTAEEEDEEAGDDTDWETFNLVDDRNMPIYVSYGINRYIEDTRLFRKKNIGSAGKLDAWRDDALGGIINFTLFFTWFRGRQEYENSIKVEDSSFEDTQLKSTRAAILTALGEEFSSIKL